MFDVLVKVGGSLSNCSQLPANLAIWSTLAGEYRLLLLPGGGPFADAVRLADGRFNLSESTAHWMAILAMDQFAYLLADLLPDGSLVRDLVTARAVATAGRLAVLAPSALLFDLDPLPHSWQVTSDSIAAWLADYANIPRLVLLKSVAGVRRDNGQKPAAIWRQAPKSNLIDCDIVDKYFGQALSPTTKCWIIDGRRPERLGELLQHGETIGTEVVTG